MAERILSFKMSSVNGLQIENLAKSSNERALKEKLNEMLCADPSRLGLHEKCILSYGSKAIHILRVPSGYLYSIWSNGEGIESSTFVPLK